jgi:hypothetical protein
MQIPSGNDRKKNKSNGKCRFPPEMTERQEQRQLQIPSGNDRKKDKSNGGTSGAKSA